MASKVREKANAFIVAELAKRGAPGLAPSHGAILFHLYRHGPLPMTRLAALIERRKNTLTTLVKKLEDQDYIVRRSDPDDSRVTIIAPTDKALAFREDFEEISRLLLKRVWGDMAKADREAVVRGLDRVLHNLG